MMPNVNSTAGRLWLAVLAVAFIAGAFFGLGEAAGEVRPLTSRGHHDAAPAAAILPALARETYQGTRL